MLQKFGMLPGRAKTNFSTCIFVLRDYILKKLIFSNLKKWQYFLVMRCQVENL